MSQQSIQRMLSPSVTLPSAVQIVVLSSAALWGEFGIVATITDQLLNSECLSLNDTSKWLMPSFTSPLHLSLLCHSNILYLISMGPEWTRCLGPSWEEGFEWTDLQTSQTPINDEPVMVRVLRLHCHTQWMNNQLETILKWGHISCNTQH